MGKKKKLLTDSQKRIILLIVGTVLTMLVLAFSLLTINFAFNKDYTSAKYYLLFVFLFLGLTKLLGYFKSKDKINLIRSLALLVIDAALGVIVLFAGDNLYLFALVAGLYSISIIVSRILRMIKYHSPRDIILNALVIVISALLSFAFFNLGDETTVDVAIILECFIIAVSAFVEVAVISFSQLKVKVLFKIIIKTYALEVLLGLITIMVGFALILTFYEESMANFGDALWYCFAVVTTIGFGDFYATSLIGRILSVILGMYGIVVVAIITSIIVNFYNETAGKTDTKELKDIKEDIDKDEKNK